MSLAAKSRLHLWWTFKRVDLAPQLWDDKATKEGRQPCLTYFKAEYSFERCRECKGVYIKLKCCNIKCWVECCYHRNDDWGHSASTFAPIPPTQHNCHNPSPSPKSISKGLGLGVSLFCLSSTDPSSYLQDRIILDKVLDIQILTLDLHNQN